MSELKKKILTQINNSMKSFKQGDNNYTCIGNTNDVEKALPCWDCKRTYINFCLECPMLVHILDNDVREDIYNRAKRTLPKDILTVGQSCSTNQTFGIFTTLTIPEGVSFGPCEGLRFIRKDSGCAFHMKNGRFVKLNKRACSNWMIYINCVAKESDGNLIMYQKNYDLYFRSKRTIQQGEELILYYNQDNLISYDQDEQEFYYPAEEGTKKKDVFACTYCCLGFNKEIYLRDHKSICPYITAADVASVKVIVQCPFCLIYLEEEEYRGFHMTCCCEKRSRRCALLENLNIPPSLPARKIIEKNEEKCPPILEMYTCSVCGYTSSFCQNFRTHACSNSTRDRPSKSPSKCATENELTKCARRDEDNVRKSITLRQNDTVSIENNQIKKCVNKTNDKTRSILTGDSVRVKVEQCSDRTAEKSQILKRVDVVTGSNSNNAGSDGTVRTAVRKSKRRRTHGTTRSTKPGDAANKDCIVISDDSEVEIKVETKKFCSEKPISTNHHHHNYAPQGEKCRKEAPVKNKSATNFQCRPLLGDDSFESYQTSFEYYLRKYRESNTKNLESVSGSSKQTNRPRGFTLVKVFDVNDLKMNANMNTQENRKKSANSDGDSCKKHISQYAACGKKHIDEDESAVHLRLSSESAIIAPSTVNMKSVVPNEERSSRRMPLRKMQFQDVPFAKFPVTQKPRPQDSRGKSKTKTHSKCNWC